MILEIFYAYTMQRKNLFLHYFCILPLLLCCVLITSSETYAADQQKTTGSLWRNKTTSTYVAPVIVDGRVLFNLVGLSAYPARQRAKKIAGKIRLLAKNPSFDPATLEIRETDGRAEIFANDNKLLAILKADADIEGDFSPQTLATGVFLPNITRAIENYRNEREREVLLKKGLSALIRTIVLAILLVFLFWSFKKTDQLLEKRFKRKIEELEAKSKKILRFQQLWSLFQGLLHLSRALLSLGLVYFFVNYVLELFPWTRYVSQTLLGYVINPLLSIWQAIVDYLPNLFFLTILFFIFRYLIRLTYAFFQGVNRGQIKLSNFNAEWAWPTYRIVRVLIIILGAVVAYPYIPGSGSQAFKGITILAGVLFSVGSSSLISNIIAGYTMTYRRAFKVGDRVKIGNNIGEVTEIRLLVTHLRSLKNEEIVIPNSTILSGEITNYSSMAGKHGLILHTTVGIGYEAPWRQVEAMLLMAAERTDGLQRRGQHFVLQTGLGDFGINYELNVFCSKEKKMAQIYTDLHRNIQDVFNEYKVAIMTQHYTGYTEDQKLVPKEQWYTSPAKPPPSDTGLTSKHI
jgi:small-conductance mechanosensitive channel